MREKNEIYSAIPREHLSSVRMKLWSPFLIGLGVPFVILNFWPSLGHAWLQSGLPGAGISTILVCSSIPLAFFAGCAISGRLELRLKRRLDAGSCWSCGYSMESFATIDRPSTVQAKCPECGLDVLVSRR